MKIIYLTVVCNGINNFCQPNLNLSCDILTLDSAFQLSKFPDETSHLVPLS